MAENRGVIFDCTESRVIISLAVIRLASSTLLNFVPCLYKTETMSLSKMNTQARDVSTF